MPGSKQTVFQWFQSLQPSVLFTLENSMEEKILAVKEKEKFESRAKSILIAQFVDFG